MFNSSSLPEILIRIPALLICLSAHEFSHGLAAYLLGDSTAKYDGRLSLNPLRHIDPIGLICMLFLRFGWAKPVMVDPRNLKNPKQDMAIISFAGPFANLLLAFIAMLILIPLDHYFLSSGILTFIFKFVLECIFLNLSLAVFNLIPIPPLDGSKLFAIVLPDALYFNFLNFMGRFGYIILLALLWLGVIGRIISPLVTLLFNGMIVLADKIYFFL